MKGEGTRCGKMRMGPKEQHARVHLPGGDKNIRV